MTRSWLSVLRWLIVAAWGLIYLPLSVRSFLAEGAGGVAGLLVVALWAGLPLLVMVAAALRPYRLTQSWLGRCGALLLLIELGALLWEIVPSPSANRDLVLPTALLAAFFVLIFVSPSGVSVSGAA